MGEERKGREKGERSRKGKWEGRRGKGESEDGEREREGSREERRGRYEKTICMTYNVCQCIDPRSCTPNKSLFWSICWPHVWPECTPRPCSDPLAARCWRHG